MQAQDRRCSLKVKAKSSRAPRVGQISSQQSRILNSPCVPETSPTVATTTSVPPSIPLSNTNVTENVNSASSWAGGLKGMGWSIYGVFAAHSAFCSLLVHHCPSQPSHKRLSPPSLSCTYAQSLQHVPRKSERVETAARFPLSNASQPSFAPSVGLNLPPRVFCLASLLRACDMSRAKTCLLLLTTR